MNDKISRMQATICKIEDLLFKELRIPDYQRPYRWTERNVRQLLEDIYSSWDDDKSSYRIGSVILHRYRKSESWVSEIVDGQQRITTILLLLKVLGYSSDVELKYNHSDSFINIRQNHNYIEEWINDNLGNKTENFKNYVLHRCEFVCIEVEDRSEAFQMFDSQNGRGKELEAYNLLKSYHIRAMDQSTQEEKVSCDVRWEEAVQYDATPQIEGDANFDVLKQLFGEQLYRSRIWMRGVSAGEFGKKHLDEFKGFTIDKNHPIKYPYQNPQLLQYLTAKFYQNTLKGTIATANRMKNGDKDNINPFSSINQTIVNGKEFFDYIETYVEMYKILFLNLGSYQLAEFKRFYYAYCLDYECEVATIDEKRKRPRAHLPKGYHPGRKGDSFLRELYKSVIMVLFDRFGEKGLEKYYKKIYRLVYYTRLTHTSIKYKTVSDLGRTCYGIQGPFQTIWNAKDLSELRIFDKLINENLDANISKTGIVPDKVWEFITKGKEKWNV